MARLLPPESAEVGAVAKEIGVSVQTLGRWREAAQSMPARGRAWTADARLEAVITAVALDEAGKSAWCREHGVYPAELEKWRLSATHALAEPEEARASPQATRQDKKRIKELERELLCKDLLCFRNVFLRHLDSHPTQCLRDRPISPNVMFTGDGCGNAFALQETARHVRIPRARVGLHCN